MLAWVLNLGFAAGQKLRVKAVALGTYRGILRDIGDVFDIAAKDISDANVSFVPVGNAIYPVYGWMLEVPETTPLYSYALAKEGASFAPPGEYQPSIKSGALPMPRTVL